MVNFEQANVGWEKYIFRPYLTSMMEVFSRFYLFLKKILPQMLEKVMNMSLNTTSKNKLEKQMIPRKGTEFPLTKFSDTGLFLYPLKMDYIKSSDLKTIKPKNKN